LIVEFLEGGVFTCGLVVGAAGPKGRLEVLDPDGRALNISPNRLLNRAEAAVPEGKADRTALLAETGRRRTALAAELDLDVLWSVLEGEGPDFDWPMLAALAFGREPGPDDVSAAMRAVHAEGLRFEFSPDKAVRRPAELVERLTAIRDREAKRAEGLKNCSAWLAEARAGRLGPEPEEADWARGVLLDFALADDEAKEKRSAKDLLRLSGRSEDALGAFHALVDVGELHEHENLDFRRLGLQRDFSPETLEEAQELADRFDPYGEPRLDLTGAPVMTIDTPGAREFDDALSLEPLGGGRRRLGVHIADPAALIPAGSKVDQEAALRASSIYLPEGRIPMLPEALTDGRLSLRRGEVRPAFSALIELDDQGEVLHAEFRPSLVSVDLQLSFHEADDALADVGSERAARLEPFLELAKLLAARRQAHGAQSLKLPRLAVHLNPLGLPEASLTDFETPGSLMVGELMILANHVAARTLQAAGCPCPYRWQDRPAPQSWFPPETQDQRVRLALALHQRRLTGRGDASLEPAPHHGLGLDVYTNFTSPIRRFMDLAVARQLRSLNETGRPFYGAQELLTLAAPAEAAQKAVKRMQNARQRYWLTHLLSARVGQEFLGLIFERQGRRRRLCVTDFMLELDLFNLPDEAVQGRDAVLRLVKANAREETLRFEFVKMVD
jgi:exoribonuclease-2